jgi:threonine/homoserine/homoserine lactone efflux protein
VLGNAAASPQHPSTPKTWVAIVDLVAGLLIAAFLVRAARRPPNPDRTQKMIAQMGKIASSPAIAIVAAGATLANPGVFIPLALKDISELNPNTGQYAGLWTVFTIASLLPLIAAVALLAVAPHFAERALKRARDWLQRHIRVIAGVILVLLAASLLYHGIAGLAN